METITTDFNLFLGALKLGVALKDQIIQLLEELSQKTANKTDKSSELQLPAMQKLTSKSSNQAFFLRILKVHRLS